jgi:hypothetical protein
VDDKFDEYMLKPLETRWEKYYVLENAKRARENVESIIRTLHDASSITDDILFDSGMWFGEATLLRE